MYRSSCLNNLHIKRKSYINFPKISSDKAQSYVFSVSIHIDTENYQTHSTHMTDDEFQKGRKNSLSTSSLA